MTNFSKRRTFSSKPDSRSGGFGRNTEMHKTTCADCGKVCEVPFKPNGKKPVYCKDCFAKNGGQVETNHFSKTPRPEYAPRPRSDYGNSEQNNQADNKKYDALARQLVTINAKLDSLVSAIESLISKK